MSGHTRVLVLAALLSGTAALSVTVAAKEKIPVATGEFSVELVGKRIGQEQFQIFKEKKKYRVECTATFYWPEATRVRYTYEVDRSFQPKELDVDLSRAGRVTEIELRPSGKDWRSEIKGDGRKKVKQKLGPREGAEVDSPSLLFSWVIFRRLKLDQGEEKTLEIVWLESSGPETKRAKRAYTRLEDEETETDGSGKVLASLYQITSPDFTERLWIDPSGFPIRSVRELPDGPLETRLVRLDVKPGAW
jgi:hypothetical protein